MQQPHWTISESCVRTVKPCKRATTKTNGVSSQGNRPQTHHQHLGIILPIKTSSRHSIFLANRWTKNQHCKPFLQAITERRNKLRYGRYSKIPADGVPSGLDGCVTIIECGGGSITLGVFPRGRRKGKLELRAKQAEMLAQPKKQYVKSDPTRRITSVKSDPSRRIVTLLEEVTQQ
jgi:hypothetical protein